MRNEKAELVSMVLAAGLATAAGAQPIDVTFSNPGGGAYANADNWSPTVVPNNTPEQTYNAILDTLQSPYTVSLDLAPRVEGFSMLTPSVTLDLSGRTLTVNQTYTADFGVITSSSPGGTIVVAGETVFGDATLVSAGAFMSDGLLKVQAQTQLNICDTCVDHGGAQAQWNGEGAINIDNGGEFVNGAESQMQISPDGDKTLTGDESGTFDNQGELTMPAEPVPFLIAPNAGDATRIGLDGSADPRSGSASLQQNDSLNVQGVNFLNNGGVTVNRGTLNLIEVANPQTNDGTLERGDWRVIVEERRIGSINFAPRDNVIALNTNVILSGERSLFPAVDTLRQIGPSGRFEIAAGRNFDAQGSLQTIGTLAVGVGSTLVLSNGFANFSAGKLFGGTYEIGGTVQNVAGQQIVELENADVRLIGNGSSFGGIQQIQLIGAGASLSIEQGFSNETQGSLQLAASGTLRVGVGSFFQLSGGLVNYFTGPQAIFQGNYEVAGLLQTGTGPVRELVDCRVAMFTPTSRIEDGIGNDLLETLELIEVDATLELRDGRLYTPTNPVTVNGTLIIDPTPGPAPLGIQTVRDTRLVSDEVVEIGADANVRLVVARPKTDGFGAIQANQIAFASVRNGTFEIVFDEAHPPDPGYEALILQTGDLTGDLGERIITGLPTGWTGDFVNRADGLAVQANWNCPADVNRDNFLEAGDISAFVELFLAQDLRADINNDKFIEAGDISAFVELFLSNCER